MKGAHAGNAKMRVKADATRRGIKETTKFW